MNLVYRHPRSGAGLWQTDAPHANSVSQLDDHDVSAVVYAARENQPSMPDRFDVIRARLVDDPFMDERTARLTAFCADQVSDLIVDYLRRGRSVVSSCWAGWNRSGLMSALALTKLGVDPDDAVKCVRRARGISALRNPVFLKIIKSAGEGRPNRVPVTR